MAPFKIYKNLNKLYDAEMYNLDGSTVHLLLLLTGFCKIFEVVFVPETEGKTVGQFLRRVHSFASSRFPSAQFGNILIKY